MHLSFQKYITQELLDELDIDYKVKEDFIRLTSCNIFYLNDFLEKYHDNSLQYDLGMKALNDFYKQIKNYQDRGFTFLSFDLSEVLIIDNNKFLLIPNEIYKLEIIEHQVDLRKFKRLLNYTSYIPKELLSLPSYKLPLVTCYYSIGLIALKIIFNNIETKNLEKIKFTQLYYILKRCIQENPKHRFLVIN